MIFDWWRSGFLMGPQKAILASLLKCMKHNFFVLRVAPLGMGMGADQRLRHNRLRRWYHGKMASLLRVCSSLQPPQLRNADARWPDGHHMYFWSCWSWISPRARNIPGILTHARVIYSFCPCLRNAVTPSLRIDFYCLLNCAVELWCHERVEWWRY